MFDNETLVRRSLRVMTTPTIQKPTDTNQDRTESWVQRRLAINANIRTDHLNKNTYHFTHMSGLANMCETKGEVAAMFAETLSRPVPDRRIVEKNSFASTKMSECDPELLAPTSGPSKQVEPLQGPTVTVLDLNSISKQVIPFLDRVCRFVVVNPSSFTGPQRSAAIQFWLLRCVESLGCTELTEKAYSIRTDDPDIFIRNLLATLGVESISSVSLTALKNWGGVTRGESVERAISGLLDLISNIKDEDLASYDAMLREKILGVAQQHDAMFMYVLMHHATVTYYYFLHDELQFVDRTTMHELSSRHLLCLVVEAIQKYREVFGLMLPMNALRDYNAYTQKMERATKEGRTTTFEGQRSGGTYQNKQPRHDVYGERPNRPQGRKVRRVIGTKEAAKETTPARPDDAYYGPPPQVSTTDVARTNTSEMKNTAAEPAGSGQAVMCQLLPNGTYMPIPKVSLLVDTGNSAETIMPPSMLPFLFNINSCNERIYSYNNKEKGTIARIRGDLMFLVEMNDGSWDYLKINGLIVDGCHDDEII